MLKKTATALLTLATVAAPAWATEVAEDSWNLTYWRTVSSQRQIVGSADPTVYFAGGAGYPIQIGLQNGRQWELASPSALEIEELWPDRSQASVLFASGVDGGLYRSGDRGATWSKLLDTSIPRFLLQRRDAKKFLLAVDDRLYSSTDGGQTFTSQPSPAPNGYDEVDALETANGYLYLFSRSGCGYHCSGDEALQRSTDGGATWQVVSTPNSYGYDARLLAHPTRPEVLYLVSQTDYYTFVSRSEDHGQTWVNSGNLDHAGPKFNAFVHSRWPNRIYVNDGDTFWRSDDLGATFTDVTPADCQAGSWTINPNGQIVAAVLKADQPWAQRILRSEDGFDSATDIGGNLFAGGSTNGLVATSQPGLYYGTSSAERVFLWKTPDHGRTWSVISELFESTSLAVDPDDPETLMYGSFGDPATPETEVLYRSRNGGATFEPVYFSSNPSSYVLRIRAVKYLQQVVWIGLLYNGGQRSLIRSTDGGETWQETPVGETPRDLIVDGHRVYWTGQNDGFYRSFDGGATFAKLPERVERPVAAGGGVVAAIDYQNSLLRVSFTAGSDWEIRNLPRGVEEIDAFYADHRGRLFLAYNGNTLLRSDDYGKSWTAMTQGLYNARIAQVVVDPFDAGQILARTWQHGVFTGRFSDRNVLTLADGRFEIQLTWRNREGLTGVGAPSYLTADTGLFWLFTRERSEVAIKLLDGRAFNGRYWLFVASLSDVEYDLDVVDLYTGEQRSFHNPQGTMASFAETQLFPLGAPQDSLTFGPGPVFLPRFDGTSVTLQNQFEVDIHWKDPLGQEGAAKGFLISGETAAFYFFEQKNIEVFVNLIDGRGVNGKFWVFLGGLSNVEYTVTVKNRANGQVRTYYNPLGSFASVADTNAF